MPRFMLVSAMSLSLVFVACSKKADSYAIISVPTLPEDESDVSQDISGIPKSYSGIDRGVVLSKEVSVTRVPVQESKPTASKNEVTNVEDPSAKIVTPEVNKLQEGTHTESVSSLQYLMCKISDLEPKIQYRLVKDRLMNAVVHFTKATKIQLGDGIYDRMVISETSWTFCNTIHLTKRCKQNGLQIPVEVCVDVTPNEEMIAWMKARDEYEEYSMEAIPDSNLKLDLSGSVSSYKFGELLNTEYETARDGLRLKIQLTPFTTGRMTFETSQKQRRGTIPQHTATLRQKIRLWVKYYSKKGIEDKPELFFNTEEEEEKEEEEKYE